MCGIWFIWKVFWVDGMDCNVYFWLVVGWFWIVCVGEDMDVMFVDDLVWYWEYELVNMIMIKVDYVVVVYWYGKMEVVWCIGLELEVFLVVV